MWPIWLALSTLLLGPQRQVSGSAPAESLSYLADHHADANSQLLDLASIASISSLPEHADDVKRAAKWVEGRLREAGLNVGLWAGL